MVTMYVINNGVCLCVGDGDKNAFRRRIFNHYVLLHILHTDTEKRREACALSACIWFCD